MDKILWQALKSRVPFRIARRLLAQNGFPRGSSWAAIEEKLKSKRIAAKADYSGLRTSLREALVASEKSLRIYTLSGNQKRALEGAAQSARPGSRNIFAQHFPFPLPDNELDNVRQGTTLLAGKVATDAAVCMVFSFVQTTEFRVLIPPSMLKQAAGSGYTEVYGLKEERRQTFNSLIIPVRGNKVYVLVDAPVGSTAESRREAHVLVRQAINALAKIEMLKETDNLFPYIKPLYNSPEGNVTHFSYTTTTASEKRERMRGAGRCLRAEIAHKTGMAALGGNVQGYEVEIAWALPEANSYVPRPELAINGTYRMTYEKKPEVSEATISKCATISELLFVIDKLITVGHAAGIR